MFVLCAVMSCVEGGGCVVRMSCQSYRVRKLLVDVVKMGFGVLLVDKLRRELEELVSCYDR